MDYRQEMKALQAQNEHNSHVNIRIYENKDALFKAFRMYTNDSKVTHSFIEKQLAYLKDQGPIYEVDLFKGFPRYFDTAEDAYHAIPEKQDNG